MKERTKLVAITIHLFTGLAMLLASSQSFAAFVIYTDETSFNTGVGAGLIVEDFEGESGTGSPLSVSGGALTQVSSDANEVFEYQSLVNGTNGFGIQGTIGWSTTFEFSEEVIAFGFETIDYFEFDIETLSFSTSAGESGTLLTAGPLPNLNVQYLGMTTNLPFNSFTLTASGGVSDGAAFDNVGYAVSAVPLPPSLGLMLAGLMLFPFVKRK